MGILFSLPFYLESSEGFTDSAVESKDRISGNFVCLIRASIVDGHKPCKSHGCQHFNPNQMTYSIFTRDVSHLLNLFLGWGVLDNQDKLCLLYIRYELGNVSGKNQHNITLHASSVGEIYKHIRSPTK